MTMIDEGVLIIFKEVLLILLGLTVFFVVMLNWIIFYNYLKKKRPKVLEKIRNKKSIIRLPTIINLDIKEFLTYLIKDDKQDDIRIKIHKRIQFFGYIIFIILIIYILFFTPDYY